MSNPLKRKIESILFSAGKNLTTQDIAQYVGTSVADVEELLRELQEDYIKNPATSLRIVRYGDEWKLTVRSEFTSLMDKIATQTDLTKTVMETLAVIAYKAPVLQSDVIKIRTNKAYEHLGELERLGYINRVKQGRTKLIRLAPKFFEYFDIPEEQLKAQFQKVKKMEDHVSGLEVELTNRRKHLEEQMKKLRIEETEQKKKLEEEIKKLDRELAKIPKLELPDGSQLEVFELLQATKSVPYLYPPSQVHVYHEEVAGLEVYTSETDEKVTHWGDFEIYRVHLKAKVEEGKEGEVEEAKEGVTEEVLPGGVSEIKAPTVEVRKEEIKKVEFDETKRIFAKGVPKEVEKQIDARVNELMGLGENKKEAVEEIVEEPEEKVEVKEEEEKKEEKKVEVKEKKPEKKVEVEEKEEKKEAKAPEKKEAKEEKKEEPKKEVSEKKEEKKEAKAPEKREEKPQKKGPEKGVAEHLEAPIPPGKGPEPLSEEGSEKPAKKTEKKLPIDDKNE